MQDDVFSKGVMWQSIDSLGAGLQNDVLSRVVLQSAAFSWKGRLVDLWLEMD